jgi:protoporphyrin/coproporphyrin ferrochelatase
MERQTDEIILCNFGGPTKEEEVRPFLFLLFDDPLVIKIPFAPLRTLLAKRISKKRAPDSNHEYAKIGYSPINKMTQAQADQLQEILRKKNPNTDVHVINRYTAPFARDVIPKLKFDGGKVFILTMYPHFCHSTTATSVREVDQAIRERFPNKEIDSTRIYSWWHNQSYLEYSTHEVKKKLDEVISSQPEGPITLMFSAHGIPKRYRDKGDPYVTETTGHFHEVKRRILAQLDPEQAERLHWNLSFQSRVGPVEWTKPYTDETIDELAKSRGGHLLVYPVSFTSDHIETLYEMDVTYKEQALAGGFQSYHRVLGANDDKKFTDCLVDILYSHGL